MLRVTLLLILLWVDARCGALALSVDQSNGQTAEKYHSALQHDPKRIKLHEMNTSVTSVCLPTLCSVYFIVLNEAFKVVFKSFNLLNCFPQ